MHTYRLAIVTRRGDEKSVEKVSAHDSGRLTVVHSSQRASTGPEDNGSPNDITPRFSENLGRVPRRDDNPGRVPGEAPPFPTIRAVPSDAPSQPVIPEVPWGDGTETKYDPHFPALGPAGIPTNQNSDNWPFYTPESGIQSTAPYPPDMGGPSFSDNISELSPEFFHSGLWSGGQSEPTGNPGAT